ncbi:hypothetical protein [Sulfurimonas sp.]|uniref:hypothetical protein n=1 Tax=Sulfurimonas sp. TaxID=2022749 RepID=UPI0025F2AC94|nr:hypothetical protein [Sulfurimonas sp.]MDD5156462.1 hypothetical protein [Sulfurimonas sp.]
MSIFQKSILNSTKQDESLVAQRWAKFQSYLAKISAIKGFKEEVYQDGFLEDIFENYLSYISKARSSDELIWLHLSMLFAEDRDLFKKRQLKRCRY